MGLKETGVSLRKKARIAASAVVCGICLALPYRARQAVVFFLHFLLNSLKVKLRLLANAVSWAFSLVILLPVYFVGIPLTALLRKVTAARGTAFSEVGSTFKEDSVLDMF